MQRYIYIHGTPGSRGCLLRMRNADIVVLFEQVPSGALVFITEDQRHRRERSLHKVPSP